MSSSSSPSPPLPAPAIGKIGPYTVFLTPPPSPSPSPSPRNAVIHSPAPPPPPTPTMTESPIPAVISPPQVIRQPPVIPPPAQYMRPDEDRFGFFWTAVARVQHVHSRVDEYVANWLGLNQSKYQWALDDFYEAKGLGKGNAKANEVSGKTQCV